jgi:hypothetical protein
MEHAVSRGSQSRDDRRLNRDDIAALGGDGRRTWHVPFCEMPARGKVQLHHDADSAFPLNPLTYLNRHDDQAVGSGGNGTRGDWGKQA